MAVFGEPIDECYVQNYLTRSGLDNVVEGRQGLAQGLDEGRRLLDALFSGIIPDEFKLSRQDAGEDFHDLMAR
jgi:hypothetical protein